MFGVRALVRGCLLLAIGGGLGLHALVASAQDTKIAFQLDWRFEGPSALFLLPGANGRLEERATRAFGHIRRL